MEVNLATIDGQTSRERVLVTLCNDDSGSRVELRQQSWGDGIGWFTQNSVSLEPKQVAQLKSALGATKTPQRELKPIQSDAPASIPFAFRADSA